MKRTVITCAVGLGLILAGAIQTAARHYTQAKIVRNATLAMR